MSFRGRSSNRDSRSGGNVIGGNVIMVKSDKSKKEEQVTTHTSSSPSSSPSPLPPRKQRTSSARSSTKTSSKKDKGGNNEKRTPIAGRMWDSFESESPSEDDPNRTSEDDEILQERNPPSRNGSACGASHGGFNSRNRCLDRGGSKEEHTKDPGGVERKVSSRSISSHELQGKKSGSTHEDAARRHSTVVRRKQRGVGLREGNRVSVFLGADKRSEKGTILFYSSGGKYNVALDNGEVEEQLLPENLSVLRGDSEDDRRASLPREGTKSHSRSKSGSRIDRQDYPPSGPNSDSRTRLLNLQPQLDSVLSLSSHSNDEDNNSRKSPSSPHSSAFESPAVSVPATGGVGSPVLQPPSTVTSSAAISLETTPAVLPSPSPAQVDSGNSSEEPDTARERGTSSEGGALSPLSPSTLRGKVRQAPGLFKTMFRRKSENWSGDEGTNAADSPRPTSRRWSKERLAAVASRRFARTNSGDHTQIDSSSAPVVDDTNTNSPKQVKTEPNSSRTVARDAIALGMDPFNFSTPGVAAPTPAKHGETSSGEAQSLTRQLSRGRKQSRDGNKNGSGASPSPSHHSPSLAAKLGITLRGAFMGKTQLDLAHEQGTGRFSRGIGSDDGGSDLTYSSSEDINEKLGSQRLRRRQRRQRSSARRHVDMSVENKHHPKLGFGLVGRLQEGHEHSSDGTDSEFFFPNSPLVPTNYNGDPRNLSEAVHSYIDARAKLEKDMGASGPVFLPRRSNLIASPGGGYTIRGKRRGSLDITKAAASMTQLTEQQLPFTEAMFKAGVSETLHSTKQGILLEGDLQKFSPESMRGVRWHKRYFVLYASAWELRYYRTHVEAAWGRIPLGERGSIPLRLVVKIEQPSDKKYRGCRFDLVVLHRGEGRHPGLQIPIGREWLVPTTKTFKFNAADAQQRLLWVTVIEALMKTHGWGLNADHRRNMRAPGHGSISGAAGGGNVNRGSWDKSVELSTFRGSNDRDLCDRHDDDVPRSRGRGGAQSQVGSNVLTFMEDEARHNIDSNATSRSHGDGHGDGDDGGFDMGGSVPDPRRGIRIPYSPNGRRGSLTTNALSAPVCSASSGRRRHQSSLKFDIFS